MISRESVPEARLYELATKAMGHESVDLGDWEIQPLHYDASNPTSLGLYRLSGSGRGPHSAGWSLILKALRSPGGVEVAPGVVLPQWVDDLPPTEFGYWQREMLLYRSGMLERLPGGIAAPHRTLAPGRMGAFVAHTWPAGRGVGGNPVRGPGASDCCRGVSRVQPGAPGTAVE